MAESVTLRTPVLVHEFASGEALAQSLVDPALALVGPSVADAKLELSLFLGEYLAALPARALVRFAAAGEPTLVRVLATLPRYDLPARLQPTATIELSCVTIPARVGSADRWVLVPALGLTCYVRGSERLEQVVAAEAARVVAAREVSAAEYLRILPSDAVIVEHMILTLGSGRSDGSESSYRVRAQKQARKEAFALLKTVGRSLPRDERRARPLLERADALALLSSLLDGKVRQSLVLVGPEGAGKSALLEAWLDGHRRTRDVPVIYATSSAELMAGMSGLGEWQARLERVLEAAELLDAILVIEDFAELVLERRGEMAAYLRAAVEQRRIRVVGELAARLVDEAERKQPALLGAFARVTVGALGAEHVRPILEAHALHHRTHAPHEPQVSSEGLGALADIAARYLPYEALPGSVVRLYDEVRRLERTRTREVTAPIDADVVYGWFSTRSGVPPFLLRERVPLRAAELTARLDAQLVGQSEAKRAIVDTLCIVKARLAPLDKPLASFLFVGPTGVGKTELSRALATILFQDASRLVRYDMSEYADASAAARLVHGGAGEHGQLTRKVREQPFCVILLDEIEKAHPAVFDLLLQLLGEARLSDERGRTAYFHNALVIMTSNLGTAQRTLRGFGGSDERPDDAYKAALRESFRPELLNRIDRVVPFSSLTRAEVAPIVALMVRAIAHRRGLRTAGCTLEVAPEALASLAEHGFSAKYGARGMRRYLEQALTAPLARVTAGHAGMLEGSALYVGVAPYQGSGHTLAQLRAGELWLTLVRSERPASARRSATTLERTLAETRRALAGHLRLDRIESLTSELETLVGDLAQPGRSKLTESLKARLHARHHVVATTLEQLQKPYRELCALEDLSFVAALDNEPSPLVHGELTSLRTRFERALTVALSLDVPSPHELTLRLQELDRRRALDRWLIGLLDAREALGLRVQVQLDRGERPRFTRELPPGEAREEILSDPRELRSALVRIRGDYVAIKLGLEAGVVHYLDGEHGDALLYVSIVSRHVDLTDEELGSDAMNPVLPDALEVLRRTKPSRRFDLAEGTLTLGAGAVTLACLPHEHFARLDEIALQHLLLFERSPMLDRDLALAGPLLRRTL